MFHNDLMVRNNPTAKVAKAMHMMMMTGVEIIFSSVLCDILEGAVARQDRRVYSIPRVGDLSYVA